MTDSFTLFIYYTNIKQNKNYHFGFLKIKYVIYHFMFLKMKFKRDICLKQGKKKTLVKKTQITTLIELLVQSVILMYLEFNS